MGLPWETPLDAARRRYYEEQDRKQQAKIDAQRMASMGLDLKRQQAGNTFNRLRNNADLMQQQNYMAQPRTNLTADYRRRLPAGY